MSQTSRNRIDIHIEPDLFHVVYSETVELYHVFQPFKKPKSFPHPADVEQFIKEQTGIVMEIEPVTGG